MTDADCAVSHFAVLLQLQSAVHDTKQVRQRLSHLLLPLVPLAAWPPWMSPLLSQTSTARGLPGMSRWFCSELHSMANARSPATNAASLTALMPSRPATVQCVQCTGVHGSTSKEVSKCRARPTRSAAVLQITAVEATGLQKLPYRWHGAGRRNSSPMRTESMGSIRQRQQKTERRTLEVSGRVTRFPRGTWAPRADRAQEGRPTSLGRPSSFRGIPLTEQWKSSQGKGVAT